MKRDQDTTAFKKQSSILCEEFTSDLSKCQTVHKIASSGTMLKKKMHDQRFLTRRSLHGSVAHVQLTWPVYTIALK